MKTISLILSVCLIVTFAIIPYGEIGNYALYDGCGFYNRLAYSLLHGSWSHLFVNIYCFLTLVFMCNASFSKFILSCLCAISIPSIFLTATPIVGLSAINYALTGMIVVNSNKAWWFILLNLLIIGATIAMPGIAFLVHLICFAEGLAIGFLLKPRYEK